MTGRPCSDCPNCGTSILGSRVYANENCTEPTHGEPVRFVDGELSFVIYVECPGCETVHGGTVPLE